MKISIKPIKYKLCITALPVIFIISSISLSLYVYSLFSFSLCLTLSLSLSLSISLLVLLFSFSLSLSFSLPTICLFLPLCLYTSLKNPCSSMFCDKMIAAAAPNRRLHIYYIDVNLTLTFDIFVPKIKFYCCELLLFLKASLSSSDKVNSSKIDCSIIHFWKYGKIL
jgi:hypothetical protein